MDIKNNINNKYSVINIKENVSLPDNIKLGGNKKKNRRLTKKINKKTTRKVKNRIKKRKTNNYKSRKNLKL
jgi:hypothetical protein